jgi:FAD:protein FMN transferase
MSAKWSFALSVFVLTLVISLLSWRYESLHNRIGITGAAQGTTYHITLVVDSRTITEEKIQQSISTTLAEIDKQLSNYREDSDISHINQQETTEWLPVSQEMMNLLLIAREVYQKSAGCYDLTVKPLFDLWGFSRHENRIPSTKEIETTLPHIGLSLLEIDSDKLRIRKKDTQLKIDLASIAHGYSVGVIANLLDTLDIHNYLVEIGGEMGVKGRKANGELWHIAIQTPTPLTQGIQKILDIKEQQGISIMTAGTYQNFFEANGQTYSHIINPKTGQPANHHLRSVTVMHENPSWADAWDTALLCVGEKEAIRIAEAEKLNVLLIYDEDNKLKEYMSTAFISAQ